MPSHKSAEKRVLTSQKARLVNRTVRSAIRTSLKKLRGAATQTDAAKEIPTLFALLDKAARRNQGDITKNTAANYKRKAHLTLAAKAK